jgi:hypothetical protein
MSQRSRVRLPERKRAPTLILATFTETHMKAILVLASLCLAGGLSGCISSSSAPPPEKNTTVVVPQSGGSTVVCSDGTHPPCK